MDYEKALDVEQVLNRMREGVFLDEDVNLLDEIISPMIANEKFKKDKRERKVDISYMQFNPISEVSKVINVISNGANYNLTAQDEVKRRDKETQDILHALELCDLTEEQTNKYGADLASIRKDRRIAKNFAEMTMPIVAFNAKYPSLSKDLRKLASDIQKLESDIKSRKYYPRELTSMEVAFMSIQEKMASRMEVDV